MAGNFKAIQARLFEPKPRSHRTGFPATLKRVASLMLSAFLFKPPRACMTTTSTKVAIRETSARFYTDTIWRLVPHVVVPTRPCGAKIGCTCAELPSNERVSSQPTGRRAVPSPCPPSDAGRRRLACSLVHPLGGELTGVHGCQDHPPDGAKRTGRSSLCPKPDRSRCPKRVA